MKTVNPDRFITTFNDWLWNVKFENFRARLRRNVKEETDRHIEKLKHK